MRIDDISGNVGINTTQPSEKLHVAGGNIRIDDAYDLRLRNSHHGLGWYGDPDGDAQTTPNKYFNGKNIDGPVLYGWNGGALASTNDGLGVRVALRWDEEGRVGIGTTEPHCKLSIRGGVNAMCIETDGSLYSDLVFKEGADPIYRNWVIRAHTSNSTTPRALEIGSINPGSEFYIVGPNTNDVKVGIGTKYLSADYMLSVNGIIRAKKVRVDAQWGDYVFDESHQRLTYEEKENFYKKFKHLPNIPSAKEIEKEGLDLGDVMKGMVVNIEEDRLDITELYKRLLASEKRNIEQQEQLEEMKKEIEKLKKQ